MGTKKIEKSEEFGSIELRPSMKLNGGNYEILGQLGDPGGFGITYLGYDVHLKSKVAIKEYFPRTYANRDDSMTIVPTSNKQDQDDFKWGYDAFVKEAQTIANLPKHPNVIDVKTLFEENGTAYFVMSYAKGEDLEGYLKDNHPMSQQEIEDIIFPFLEGVKHIHSYDILHRDIKLANILITEDKQPILIDFGTARNQLLQRSKKLTAVYTEGYASLEQHTESKEGPYTDIYAIGMVLYSMMNGITETHLLPTAIKRFDAMHSKKASLLTFPDDGRFSRGFINAVKKALEVEAKNRPQSVAELIRLLKEGVSEDTSTRKPEKIPYIIGSLVAVALLGVGYFYMGSDKAITPIAIVEVTPKVQTPKISVPITKPVSEEDIDYFNEAKLALVQGDSKKAIEYFKNSANSGNALAAFELGEMYDLKLNKLNSAIEWYAKAEELGNIKAKYPLAILYCQRGNFKKFNSDSGIVEYAKNSRKEVKYDVALCFNEQGNINEAKKWFERAASMGYAKAKENLYIILREEFGYDDVKAREHIKNLNN